MIWHGRLVPLLTTNPHITPTWKMTRGFDQVIEVMPHPDHLKAGNGANVVLRNLRRIVSTLEEPFFLYVHLIDPHWPFDPPKRDLQAVGFSGKTAGTRAR